MFCTWNSHWPLFFNYFSRYVWLSRTSRPYWRQAIKTRESWLSDVFAVEVTSRCAGDHSTWIMAMCCVSCGSDATLRWPCGDETDGCFPCCAWVIYLCVWYVLLALLYYTLSFLFNVYWLFLPVFLFLKIFVHFLTFIIPSSCHYCRSSYCFEGIFILPFLCLYFSYCLSLRYLSLILLAYLHIKQW